MHFFLNVSANFFLFLIFFRSSSLLFSLGLVILGLSFLSFLGCLTPSCERFLNYFKEGKKHFIV
jgi:hypothetical protein